MKPLTKFSLGLMIAALVFLCCSALPDVRGQSDHNKQVYLPLIIKPSITITQYGDRTQWANALGGKIATENFEKETPDYNEIILPYHTANGLLLSGKSIAQIIIDPSIMNTGILLHFRDWQNGMTISFPGSAAVYGIGFDYVAPEEWHFKVGGEDIILPKQSKGFIGVVINNGSVPSFVLSSSSYAQGGISVDNISYDEP